MRQQIELTVLPPEFSVTVEGKRAIIAFFTDVETHERQEQEGTTTYYTATYWTMATHAQENLAERIGKHPDLWLKKVKAVTETEEAEAALRELEKTATDDAVCDLADMAVTHDDAIAELAEIIAGMQEE